ncbi:hypothetical protein [Desulfovibrio sp. 86]|uniref:Uncharacterized protein n=1 Tax=uncultured Desulfovibrio sp. TaxID=167968 RepID=A0A212L8P4_9BACT|nr:hypothetical protein [Desulfovibrio sp. 86]SCM73942.1 conserved membrane hypothetical protein [uncultured Desulfovibrio sp.]VZH34541.1 conserved membrane protein of unknown function [Desulfovibrio sp. 86]
MRISVDNRHRIVLLAFIIVDHFIWLYGGHWEQASFAYVVMTECIRIFVGIALVVSFFYKKILEIAVNFILSYCAIMMLLNFIGGTDKTNFSEVPGSVDNVFWFKKDRLVPIDHGFLAAVVYLYFILSAYFFSGKYFNKNTMIKTKP